MKSLFIIVYALLMMLVARLICPMKYDAQTKSIDVPAQSISTSSTMNSSSKNYNEHISMYDDSVSTAGKNQPQRSHNVHRILPRRKTVSASM